MSVIDNQSVEELEDEHSNEALSGDNGGYYNISEVTKFINIEELHRVISEKNAGAIKPFLTEYKVWIVILNFGKLSVKTFAQNA